MAETIFVITDDERLEKISEQIVRFANADFSGELEISDRRDNLDSIIVGLNLLGEELKCHIEQAHEREKQLKKALFLLNEAQHLAHLGSWEWSIPDNRITWTDELYRIFGVDQSDFEPSHEGYMEFVHPDDAALVEKMVREALNMGQSFSIFHRIIRKDGSEGIVHSRGEVFLDEDKRMIKMSGTIQDVTDIKAAEQDNFRLSAIVESSSDAIISKDLNGIVTTWNKRAEQMFGYTAEEMIGTHISRLFPSHLLNEENTIMESIMKGESIINMETERRRKDGIIISVALTLSPIYDAQKRITGVSKIARDITDKKRAEEKLKKYTQELEYKNNESKQFSYIASHDLQEPLRTIKNYIGLFAEDYKGRLDANADTYIRFISSAAGRMQTLIHDLLEYNSIDNDETIEEIDLKALVLDILQSMSAAITASNASVKVGDLPVISGIVPRMRSLFQNLISNAIKYQKPGAPPVVQIRAYEDGNYWQFEVEDNGIGIEPQYFDRIFRLFQRLHSRNEYEGTGIGLAHCKKIVELRGGRIWVESEVGKGSTFFVRIPKKLIL